MANSRPAYAEEQTTVQANGRPQSLWTAVAPPMAWWWLVIAGAAALILGLGFLNLVQLFARPLGLFILGIAIATSLAPLVNWLARWLPRALAVILLYLMLLLLLIIIGWTTLPGFIGQIEGFSNRVPQLAIQVQTWFSQRLPVESSSFVSTLTSWLSTVGGRLITLPLTLANSVVAVFLVLFISLYTLIVVPQVQAFLLSLLPERRRADTAQLLDDMAKAMGGYVRGVILSGLIIGGFTYLGLWLLGVDYPLLLAALAGLLEIIPVLGSLTSSVIIVGVALLQSPQLALFALVFVVILQLVEGNIVFPTVMSSQTNISPLLGLVAFFAGSVVGGLLGALVAIPLAAAIRVLVIKVVAPMVRRWTGATPPTELSSKEAAKEAR
jgi:predicted PurR-regulated permease PerM